MKKITERTQRLQALFGDIAKNVAQATQFIRRERKITALSWLLATVFGWLSDKNGSRSRLFCPSIASNRPDR